MRKCSCGSVHDYVTTHRWIYEDFSHICGYVLQNLIGQPFNKFALHNQVKNGECKINLTIFYPFFHPPPSHFLPPPSLSLPSTPLPLTSFHSPPSPSLSLPSTVSYSILHSLKVCVLGVLESLTLETVLSLPHTDWGRLRGTWPPSRSVHFQ